MNQQKRDNRKTVIFLIFQNLESCLGGQAHIPDIFNEIPRTQCLLNKRVDGIFFLLLFVQIACIYYEYFSELFNH